MSDPDTMPPRLPLPLTLIVAATPSLGIGANGTLPWRIKSEMQYFARVTTRLPPAYASMLKGAVQNAVIMGRKTWESIPVKFRPLKGRLNVVLTGKAAEVDVRHPRVVDGAIWAKNLEEALRVLEGMRVDGGQSVEEGETPEGVPRVARAFVIGGAGVYKSALQLPGPVAQRVLLTRVYGDHECDTFFLLDLDGEVESAMFGWERKSNSDLSEWVGEDVPEGKVREGDIEFEYCMYENRHAMLR